MTAFYCPTLFQPHKRLQPLFLVFLITPNPLRLDSPGHWGASAQERLLQHNRTASSGGEHHTPAKARNQSRTTAEDQQQQQQPLKHQVGTVFAHKYSVFYTHPGMHPYDLTTSYNSS